uniref:Uncharacterized protein n=1 Tax=Corvus moneduloides TaxID=1196302 RepID=A0A8U7NZP6_CORMO
KEASRESWRTPPTTSFYGRFRHFLDIIDPRTLFVTEVMRAHLCFGQGCLLDSWRLKPISAASSRRDEPGSAVGLCLTGA